MPFGFLLPSSRPVATIAALLRARTGLLHALRFPHDFPGRPEAAQYIRVDDRSVSRRHAELQAVEGGLRITDLESRNGTFIDGVRVRSGCLTNGRIVRFGNMTFEAKAEALLVVPSANDDDTCSAEEGAPRNGSKHATEQILSEAQHRVFDLLLTREPEKIIARRLGLSPHTVHNHIRRIFNLFGVHSQTELLTQLMKTNERHPPL
jgi:DNA-binding CsgD family transcriptional regulator